MSHDNCKLWRVDASATLYVLAPSSSEAERWAAGLSLTHRHARAAVDEHADAMVSAAVDGRLDEWADALPYTHDNEPERCEPGDTRPQRTCRMVLRGE
jgi:hypothetical protein